MANVAPQIPPASVQNPQDSVVRAIENPVAEDALPSSLDLFISRSARELAKETGESVEATRNQLRATFSPLPSRAAAMEMDWDDTETSNTPHPVVPNSGVVSRNRAPASQLISDDEQIPVYVDKGDLEELAS